MHGACGRPSSASGAVDIAGENRNERGPVWVNSERVEATCNGLPDTASGTGLSWRGSATDLTKRVTLWTLRRKRVRMGLCQRAKLFIHSFNLLYFTLLLDRVATRPSQRNVRLGLLTDSRAIRHRPLYRYDTPFTSRGLPYRTYNTFPRYGSDGCTAVAAPTPQTAGRGVVLSVTTTQPRYASSACLKRLATAVSDERQADRATRWPPLLRACG